MSSLYQGLLDASDPGRLEIDAGFLEALDTAAAEVGERFRDLPEAEGCARASIAHIYLGLGRHADALPHARRALALAETSVGYDGDDRETLQNLIETIEAAESTGG